MCGIAGVVGGGLVDRELLQRMCDSLAHRGPDGEGMHLDGAVGLGMRRLAIIDLETGDQPIYSEDGRTVLVFNGEIYNYRELARELRARGHRFAGESDSEVIVHLYEELGADCVHRLRGMFAFAIWDGHRGELLLARDRVGKKPLYWTIHDGALRFASEPRAILQDETVPRTVDYAAIDAFLVNQYVPQDMCAFAALRKLAPASRLQWRPGSEPTIERWWRLEYAPKQQLGLDEAAERLRAAILEATRLRLRSDVPVGAFLSGGVDSSVVVAAMAQASADPVRTFSVSFPDTPLDEAPYARAVAERWGTRHEELVVEPATAAMLPRIAWHFGEPFADPAALPTFQLSEVIRRQVTVALNGDGGDESFSGYGRYRQLALTRPADRLPMGVRRAVAALTARAARRDGKAPVPRAARLARRLALPPAHRYSDLFRYLGDDDRRALYRGELAAAAAGHDPLAHVAAAWDARAGLGDIDRLMAVDLDTYLADDLLAKVDVTSMAQSIEVRSPLLDHELMELAASLPPSLKRRGADAKVALRAAARPWLPDSILDRPKQGFGVPLGRWLRGELRSLPEDVLLDPAAVERGILDPGGVRRLVDEHRQGRPREQQLWALISLELWFRTCVDRAAAHPSQLSSLP
jgi:asparagine synthase (glutamine-hydrolysing)